MLQFNKLRSGEELLFTGTIYTARDQAHKRLVEAIKNGKKLPIPIKGQIIYYCGPTQTPKGQITCGERSRTIGSCGPTTSSRMDEFTPMLLKAGLAGMIGKGRRSKEVVSAIKKHKAVYFLAYAGCGALISQFIKTKTLVAYPDLGAEAIYKLEVENFPLIVGIDSQGKDIYGKI